MTPRMSMSSHRSVFNRLQSHDTASSAAKKVCTTALITPTHHQITQRPPSRGGYIAEETGMSPSMHASPYHSPSPLLTARNAGSATPRAMATPRTMATPRMAWRPATAGGAPLTARPSTAGSITHRPGSSHRRMAAPRFLDMRPRYATSGTSAQIDPKDAVAVADPSSDLDKFLGSSDNIQVVVQLRDANPAALTGLPVVPPRGISKIVA